MEREFGYTQQFWDAIKSSKAVISGSFLFNAVSGVETWQSGDLDIFRKHVPLEEQTGPFRITNDHNPTKSRLDSCYTTIERYLWERCSNFLPSSNRYNDFSQFVVRDYTMDPMNEAKLIESNIERRTQNKDEYDARIQRLNNSPRTIVDCNNAQIQTPRNGFIHEHFPNLWVSGGDLPFCAAAHNYTPKKETVVPVTKIPRTHCAQIIELMHSFQTNSNQQISFDETIENHIDRSFDLNIVKNTYNGAKLVISHLHDIRTRRTQYVREINPKLPRSIKYHNHRIEKYQKRGITIDYKIGSTSSNLLMFIYEHSKQETNHESDSKESIDD